MSPHFIVKRLVEIPRHPLIDLHNVRPIIIDEMETLPRLSATERLILELLATDGELFGLEMIERSGGRLKRGTVYVTLGRMQGKGYLESRQEPLPPGGIGLPRRLYRPSGLGRRILDAWTLAERAFVGPRRQEA